MKHFLKLTIVISLFFVSLAHADYLYQVDYFEVVGNQPGSARDDFDDNVVAPWFVEEQTVTESGGTLNLSTPGVIFGPMSMGGASWIAERSNAGSPDDFDVFGGSGDFTATSGWTSGPAGQNQFFGMALSSWKGSNEVDVNLNMYNLDPYYADAIGIPSGLGIWYLLDQETQGVMSFQTVSIDPSAISGDILLRIHFDDGADLFSASYSLDGGTTYITDSFTTFSYDLNIDDMDWYLEAEEFSVPEPATMLLLGLGGLVMLRKRK